MKLVIQKPKQPLRGTAEVPGDKSLSHRTALLAALAQGDSRIENYLVSGVTSVLLNALRQTGTPYDIQGTTLTVHGRGYPDWHTPQYPLDCGNSATTMRLLAGALALSGVRAVLDGSARLRQRPMARIAEPLQQMGVTVQTQAGHAPICIERDHYPLKPIEYTLPEASAQVKTCLLLAGLAADKPSTLIEPGPSRDHTERLLRLQGITVISETIGKNGHSQVRTILTPPQRLRFTPLNMRLPGDFSAAAFLIVAALIVPGSEITLRNVGLNPTRTGLLDALLAMQADIHILSPKTLHGEPVGDLIIRSSNLRGIEIDGDLVVRMIDEFPVFAVAAAAARGQTSVRNAGELRHKESDRIASLCQELGGLGVDIHETADGFEIHGAGGLPGSASEQPKLARAHQDHRLAMAWIIAGLASPDEMVVDGAEAINESFPGFVALLNQLGAHISEVDAE